jgi:hypothetical protein
MGMYLDSPNGLKKCKVLIFDKLTNIERCTYLLATLC